MSAEQIWLLVILSVVLVVGLIMLIVLCVGIHKANRQINENMRKIYQLDIDWANGKYNSK